MLIHGAYNINFSKDNVARVEAMIHHNSGYDWILILRIQKKVAYKFQHLKNALIGNKNIYAGEYRIQIEELVTAIDK
ncbi:MAG: hypothetical protein E7274_05945 [Pseudobutyrivibrio ruminis]|uniref:hypothetical protein n=1 Tax=Pseudobutyrivibrio ruminis TaxID=46206 RepID=UPI0026ED2620|nr:hypothetical protein [Pseudobutyrivibrio ruminis]MBE5913585.1 hypothetical protein [Pseudobutyrivibrio ruminis]